MLSFQSYPESGNGIKLFIGRSRRCDRLLTVVKIQHVQIIFGCFASNRVALLRSVEDLSRLLVRSLPICNLQEIEGTFPESRRFLNPECRRHPAALGESRHVRSTLALKFLAATTLRVDRRNLDLTSITSAVHVSLMVIERRDLEVQRSSEDHRACDSLSHDNLPCLNRYGICKFSSTVKSRMTSSRLSKRQVVMGNHVQQKQVNSLPTECESGNRDDEWSI